MLMSTFRKNLCLPEFWRKPGLALLMLFMLFAFWSCGESREQRAEGVPDDWSEVLAKARGQNLDWGMWMGDPQINAYVNDYVKPILRDSFGIELNVISVQGPQIVQLLLGELDAGAASSAADLVWINGETFYQLRQLDALWGPWTQRLPNIGQVDLENPFIGRDFQQDIAGYEMPWGNVQMTLIYDTLRVRQVPRTRAELLEWVKANPGRFTWDTQFTGLTFLKALLMDIAGGPEALAGEFQEDAYAKTSAALWDYVRELQPYLWREGKTFPEGVAQVHQMFANAELDFTMSNNDAEVDNKRLQGVFPETARAYVPEFGTIQNSHYVGIPALAQDKEAALVLANLLISVPAQLRKSDPAVWGDGTVLNMSRLDAEQRAAFAQVPERRYAPAREALNAVALPELAPEYMIRLADDFRKEIIQR